jgi:hypothetical protein
MHRLGHQHVRASFVEIPLEGSGIANTSHFANLNANVSAVNLGAITRTINAASASINTLSGQREWWFGGQLEKRWPRRTCGVFGQPDFR